MITTAGIRLAPFYDLISTAVYPGLTTAMAMKIGGENRPDWIQERHWKDFAEISGANPRLVRMRMRKLSDTIDHSAGELLTRLKPDRDEHATLEKIRDEIRKRAKRLSELPGT